MPNLLTISGTALALIASSAAAQSDPATSPLIVALERCLAIPADAERLACTDAAARRLIDASRSKDVVIVNREDMKKTRKSLFGFTLPQIGLFGKNGPDAVEEIDRIEMAVTRVATLGYGKLGFTMEDGARWNTTEAWADPFPPKAGTILIIKRGAIGSYMISVKGGRTTRAMRVG